VVANRTGKALNAVALHGVVAALYDAAFGVPLDDYQEFALETLRALIPFDSASWAVANNDINAIHSLVRINQSLETLADYLANWQADDFLRHHAIANPGLSFRNEDLISVEEWLQLPIYNDFCRGAGVEHTLGISILDPITRLSNMIYLWRADIAQPFSDQERDHLQLRAPHLTAGWRHRQIVGLYLYSNGGQDRLQHPVRGHAIVDNFGIIHSSDAGFGSALEEAFPDWRGPALPDAVKAMIASDARLASISGFDFDLMRSDQRHILTIIGESASLPLTRSELKAAQLYASGATYQNVAAQLGISGHTVRNQLSAAYRKLGVSSKVGLAVAIKSVG
jgi:DNA-binding CsgD family transcriptional regulator